MSNDGNLRQEEGPALWMKSWPVNREFLSCSRSENGPGGRSRPGNFGGRELGIPVHSRGGREPGRRGVKVPPLLNLLTFAPPSQPMRLALFNAYYNVIILIAGIFFSGGTIVRFQGSADSSEVPQQTGWTKGAGCCPLPSIFPVPPARKLRIGYHIMRRHALHTLGASDPGGLIGGEHTDATDLAHPTMKAKGIQTDLRVRDDVCGPGPTYMVLALLTQRTLPTAEEPWRGEGKTNSGSRNFPVAIGSGRDNAAAICRGADPEILASNKP
ncbi:hypothetical protein ASPTUDRAFT_53401 [Aspergillus tubingensis CBS 134.48]|uniref:Uncharacterized protein n=1 Tax=Aspergillus tubingensis (strain CBS 134.48) TaxID=767770 RepID=A0A1L9N9X8_ASPTC|nr:hypothetical protein ASPTUDRAFT_53401 [Aspergillus tubingensis CBS 134.48]